MQDSINSLNWFPKLHKKPYGSRFIAASNKCTTKQLSSLLILLVLKPYLLLINNVTNSQRACAARVTIVVLCVYVCLSGHAILAVHVIKV